MKSKLPPPQSWLPSTRNGNSHWGDISLYTCYCASVTFIVGIIAACFTMIPKLGGEWFEDVVRLFVTDELTPKTFSLIGGILHLFHSGDLFIGGLLLLFSIVFPTFKLLAIFYFLHQESDFATKKNETAGSFRKVVHARCFRTSFTGDLSLKDFQVVVR